MLLVWKIWDPTSHLPPAVKTSECNLIALSAQRVWEWRFDFEIGFRKRGWKVLIGVDRKCPALKRIGMGGDISER
jgi:hypothetical protein